MRLQLHAGAVAAALGRREIPRRRSGVASVGSHPVYPGNPVEQTGANDVCVTLWGISATISV